MRQSVHTWLHCSHLRVVLVTGAICSVLPVEQAAAAGLFFTAFTARGCIVQGAPCYILCVPHAAWQCTLHHAATWTNQLTEPVCSL